MEDGQPKKRRRRKKKKKSKVKRLKKELKLILIITGLCFVSAVILSFLTGKFPSFVDSVVDKQIEGAMGRQMKQMGMPGGGRGLPGGMDMNQLRRRMGR